MNEVAAALTEFINRKAGGNLSLVCTVKSVNTTDLTCYCEPVDDFADIQQVRLNADKASDGFLAIPKVDSLVVVTFLSESSAYVSMFSQVDEIRLCGNGFGGLVVSGSLVTRINGIESKVNAILNLLKTWTVVAGDGGAALKAAMLAVAALTPTVESDISSDNVFHGNSF